MVIDLTVKSEIKLLLHAHCSSSLLHIYYRTPNASCPSVVNLVFIASLSLTMTFITFTRPCTDVVSLHHRIANVAPLSKRQITLYLHVSYIMYQEEQEVCRFWMMQLNAGFAPPLPASNLGNAAARGGKRINPWP